MNSITCLFYHTYICLLQTNQDLLYLFHQCFAHVIISDEDNTQ